MKFKIGDKVRVKGEDQVGFVIEHSRWGTDKIRVQFHTIKCYKSWHNITALELLNHETYLQTQIQYLQEELKGLKK